MENEDENSKNTSWQKPLDLKGLKKGAYNKTMNASSGSQNMSGSADPGGDAGSPESKGAHKLTHQEGNSG